jgi:hypothetical protein
MSRPLFVAAGGLHFLEPRSHEAIIDAERFRRIPGPLL